MIVGGVFIMPRKPRIEYKGAVYHITHRGNNKEFIFEDAEDKIYLLSTLAEMKESMGLILMGYVIMNNHYHFLIKTEKKPLSFIMQKLNNRYARYFNRKTQRSGHVFGDRYKSFIIADDKYLLTALRYIHQNPVKAKIVDNSYDYKWSSDMHYRTNNNRFVDIEIILDLISNNRKKAIRQYIDFMGEDTLNLDFESIEVIGDKHIDKKLQQTGNRTKTLDEILWSTGIDKETFDLIKSRSRIRKLTPYKLEYIKLAQEQGYTLKEIAENINSSTSAIGNFISRNRCKS